MPDGTPDGIVPYATQRRIDALYEENAALRAELARRDRRSVCCNASPLNVQSSEEGAAFYRCPHCGEPCDAMPDREGPYARLLVLVAEALALIERGQEGEAAEVLRVVLRRYAPDA